MNALSPQHVRLIRRHRIECIALGMALSKAGDRDVVLSRLHMCDLASDKVNDCLDAIREQDAGKLIKILETWGIHNIDINNLAKSVTGEVQRRGDEQRARDVMLRALSTADASELEQTLESALVELQTLKGGSDGREV